MDELAALKASAPSAAATADPMWYKDALIYEVHVRAFCDSNGDGIGDFPGLTSKLDYLKDLGVTALWLLPFYPSPLKDDGYDIATYMDIHPAYGTLADFKAFLKEAHRRGLRVITELVLNHTSDQHPWFQRARRAKRGSAWRDFYVWSETPDKFKEARIIFKDFEQSNWTWDPVAKAYYWHRFYSHQPDLNYDNPRVRRLMFRVLDFWMGLGVDGFRLDAVPYLFEREGTTCESLPETHAYLRELRAHVDQKFPDRMLLAEANQWPEDAVSYFGSGRGDECHTAFHFPLMPRMFMALRTEDRFPIVDILEQTPSLPETGQWVLFLRNHDELTLEMVTDEERDYMYRVYALDEQARINAGIRRRLAPLLAYDRRRIELLNGLLFSLPGTPVLYYGDEIGMGDNIYLGDRNGVRTPMQWSSDRNAGFSGARSQRLYLPVVVDPEAHYESCNVETQQNNPQSLLWWTKRLIALRKRWKAFGRGSLEILHPDNRKVLAFVRRFEEECVLVVANLSRFVSHVELNLSRFAGRIPVECFGGTEFPSIGQNPYSLTLGPHNFFWFSLEAGRPRRAAAPADTRPVLLTVKDSPAALLRGASQAAVDEGLLLYLKGRDWLGSRAKLARAVRTTDAVPVTHASGLRVVQVEFADGDSENYILPLAFASGERAAEIRRLHPRAVVASLKSEREEGVFYDAYLDRGFCQEFLEAVSSSRRFKGIHGELQASAFPPLKRTGLPVSGKEVSLPSESEGSVSVACGGRFALKLFRRLEGGVSPDLELGRFLTEQASFGNTPPLVGALEYRAGRGEPATVGLLHSLLAWEATAWQHTLDNLGPFFEKVLALPELQRKEALAPSRDLPPLAFELVGPYLRTVELLGERTAAMHRALASAPPGHPFELEPTTAHEQRPFYQSLRNLTREACDLLRRNLAGLHEVPRAEAERILAMEPDILRAFQEVARRKLTAMRMRCHGDYHLGRLIHTGKDFLITGFEGEPRRSLSQRRMKRSPLRDVACMLRSFHYACYSALFGRNVAPVIRPEDLVLLEAWARQWQNWVQSAFLKAYLAEAAQAPFLPASRAETDFLLSVFLREKALHELIHDLRQRPDWATIPLRGLSDLLGSS